MTDADLPAWLTAMRDHHDRLPAAEPAAAELDRWFDGMQVPEEWFA